MNNQIIVNNSDTMEILDDFFNDERKRWNNFFENLKVDHPLSSVFPDESLIDYLDSGKIPIGNVLDIGCGNGRNSVLLAEKGFTVDALDISDLAIEKTEKLARTHKVKVTTHRGNFFNFNKNKKYNLIYDAGMFHHIFPHRRPEYIDSVCELLVDGGLLAIIAFNEKMGASISDFEIYLNRNMEGGISYPLEKLKSIFEKRFELLDYREMKNMSPEDRAFGHDFVSVSLWRFNDSKN
ncbi:MAG: class I SAM-dependent methyltransferase [Halobacteriovoraceae bacterium]|jgi:2-polyprenyl-3-methyl-5-hydroxy-6-metoxy-1,4-benzoquinol methylase|nr:class I SAM-dependent methyltransferase [Halobacteriovoraceae bacterium]